LGLAGSGVAHAQKSGQTPKQLEGVGLDQRLGATLPTDLTFRTEQGDPVQLSRYFDGSTPVILTLNYHRCPQLCQIQLRKFASALNQMAWTVGEKFRVVTVDMSPTEGPEVARKAETRYTAMFDRPDTAAEGWHFLTGSAGAIDALTDSVGFRYKPLPDKPNQYAHPAAAIFVSGSGTVTRYFTTLDPAPGSVRTALVEASDGEIGSLADQAFLACARFNPDSNSYSARAFALMRYGSVLFAVIIGAALFVFWRREKDALETASEEAASDADLDAALEKRIADPS